MRFSKALFEDVFPSTVTYGTRRAVVAFGGGFLSVLGFMSSAYLVWLSPLLSLFFLVPLFCVGYSWGLRGYIEAAGFFLGLGMLFTGGLIMAPPFFLVTVAFLIVMMTLRFKKISQTTYYYPVGRCFAALIGLSLGLLLLVEVCFAETVAQTMEAISKSLCLSFQEIFPYESSEQLAQIEGTFKTFMDYIGGLCLSIWMILLFVNASVAIRILSTQGSSLRPPLRFLYMELPSWVGWLTAVVVLGLFLYPSSLFLKNAVVIIMLGYGIQGLGVIHTEVKHKYCGKEKKIKIMLGFFYVCVVLFPWILGGVACLGLLDQGFKLKQRIISRRD